MDRLTEPNHTYNNCEFMESGMAPFMNRLAAYEDTGLTPEEIDASITDANDLVKVAVALRKLRKYEEAESDGRLIVLPCKVGDTVWVADRGEILKETVFGFSTFKKNDGEIVTAMTTTYRDFFTQPTITDFGKLMPDNRLSFFLTREEAEAALEEEQT